MKIRIKKDAKKLAKMAGKKLGEMIEKESDKPILLLVSGGSSFSVLDYFPKKLLNKNITIGVLDERFDESSKVNNFLQLKKTDFYKSAEKSGCAFIDSSVKKGESLTGFSLKIDNKIKHWIENNHYAKVFATMGVGADGHTAGIMPFPKKEMEFEKLFNNDNFWVVGYDAGEKNLISKRATVNNTFLEKIVSGAVVYAVGEEKKSAIKKLSSEEKHPLNEFPAGIIREMRDVYVFTNVY